VRTPRLRNQNQLLGMRKVIIVGAGPGGLASAILLASAGVKVKILERLPTIGGRTSSIRSHGFTFDLGPTFFLYPRVLRDIFAAVGTNLADHVELVRLDPQYRIVFGKGGELAATPDLPQMERQIAAISPTDAGGFDRFMRENREKLRRMEPCLETPFSGWRSLCQTRLLKMLPLLRPHQSIDSYLKRFFQDERIRLAFRFNRNISACRRFAVRVCFQFSHSSNSSTVSFIQLVVVAALPGQWPMWQRSSALRSPQITRLMKFCSGTDAPSEYEPGTKWNRRMPL